MPMINHLKRISKASTPSEVGAKKKRITKSIVGINNGCRAAERKLASRLFTLNIVFQV